MGEGEHERPMNLLRRLTIPCLAAVAVAAPAVAATAPGPQVGPPPADVPATRPATTPTGPATFGARPLAPRLRASGRLRLLADADRDGRIDRRPAVSVAAGRWCCPTWTTRPDAATAGTCRGASTPPTTSHAAATSPT